MRVDEQASVDVTAQCKADRLSVAVINQTIVTDAIIWQPQPR